VYVSEGYGTIFPYMIVDRVNEFVGSLRRVFNARGVGRTEFPDGRVANIEQAGIIDPFGNAWWISRRLVERPYHSE